MNNFNISFLAAVQESSIVTDGLVSAWDMGNSKSYSPNNNLLYDLTPYQNYGTLVNYPSFSTSKGEHRCLSQSEISQNY